MITYFDAPAILCAWPAILLRLNVGSILPVCDRPHGIRTEDLVSRESANKSNHGKGSMVRTVPVDALYI